MSALTKWSIAVIVVALIGGATLGLGLAEQRPPRETPKPAEPAKPAAEIKRDRFNDPLPPRAIARMGTVSFRPRGSWCNVRFALDGKVLVSIGLIHAYIWETETGRELGRRGGMIPIDDESIRAAGVVDFGKAVMVHGTRDDGTNHVVTSFVWDLATQRETRHFTLGAHEENVYRLPTLFAPSGSAIASVSSDGSAWLWDGEGKPTHTLKNVVPTESRHDPLVAFTPDGKWLVTIDDAQLIRVWDVITGKTLRSMGGKLPRPDHFAVSPDGKHIATISRQEVLGAAGADAAMPERVRIWELTTGKLVREIPWGDETWMNHRLFLEFAGDGKSVLVVDDRVLGGMELRQWNVSDGALVNRHKITGYFGGVASIAVHPNDRILALGTFDGIIRLFDLATGNERTPTDLHLGGIRSLAFGASGEELRTVATDGTARTWTAATGKLLKSCRLDGTDFRLTPGGEFVLDGKRPGKTAHINLKIRDSKTGDIRREINGILGYAMAADGKSIWKQEDDRSTITRLDLTNNKVGVSFRAGSDPPVAATSDVVVTSDGRKIAGWDATSGAKRFEWSAVDTKLLRSTPEGSRDRITDWVISPDGRFIALAVHRRPPFEPEEAMTILCVCDLKTGKIVWQIKSLQNICTSLAFRPDGKILAAGGWKLKLYDAATGKELTEYDGHQGYVLSLAFSADGKRLASGASDGSAMVWEVK